MHNRTLRVFVGQILPYTIRSSAARLRCAASVLIGLALTGTAVAALTAPATLSTANLKATSFTLKWSAASGAVGGISGYDVYIQGGMIGTTATRSFVVTGLAPMTTYRMTVVARDNSGHVSAASAILSVTTPADTTAPGKPTALLATAVTTNSFTLSWTAPTDNIAVTAYNIYRSNVLVGSSPTASYHLTGLAPDTGQKMTVRAMDAAGNISAASAVLTVRTLADPPSAPSGLSAANVKAASFTLKWSASTGGTGGIAGYDVYRNGVLAGTTTKKSLAFTAQAPLTTYSLTVVARDHEGRVSAASASLSVTTPADTTKPTVPQDLSAASVTHQSFTLTWTPSTDNVGVTGYDVLRNNVTIGSPITASFPVTGLAPLTPYLMKVKARDAAGNISGLSAALSVTTAATPNVAPTVNLTTPASGSLFTLPLTLALSAVAMDRDGSIAKVEFFDGTAKLGESLTASTPPDTFTLPVAFTAPGPRLLFARATDNRHATTDSGPVPIRLLSGLPYVTDFEEGEGYAVGSLHDQLGWTVAAGAARVTALDAAQGEQSVRLEPGATVSFVDQEIGAGATSLSPVFGDVFVKPVAGATPAVGSVLDLDNARIAFIDNGTAGRFTVLDGDGQGGGTWKNLTVDVAIDANRAASAWHRLSVRLDYAAKTWDFYLDGRLLACDLKFRSNTAAYFSGISIQGHATVASGIDDLYVGPDNPLFTDADHDGMDDAWENANGLNPAINDRDGDLDGDGLSNIREFQLGTNPSKADTDGDGLTDAQELALGTNPLAADSDGDGLPDGWEQAHGLNALSDADAALDTDGDGKTNLEEYAAGSDPADYYNGATPVITVLAGGDGSPGANGLLQVRVATAGGETLANAPVSFGISAGSSQLAVAAGASGALATTVNVRTTADGSADAYYRTPTGLGVAGTVSVHAGLAATDLVFPEPNGGGGGSNQPPSVALVAPAADAVINSALGLVLLASATDADGSITKVEFFADGVKVGEATTAPYYYVWTSATAGTHALTAKATDNSGAAITSEATTITSGPPAAAQMVYDFEPSEGFAAGALTGTNAHGWSAFGDVEVTAITAQSGAQSVVILPPPNNFGANHLQRALPNMTSGQTERFIDFWWKPVAEATFAASSTIDLGGPSIAFVRTGNAAELRGFFDNEGQETRWDSGISIPVGSDGVALDWQHITLRQNPSGRIDVYLNGQPALADVADPDSDNFRLFGHAVQPTRLDHFRVLADNPLFADADHDGMDDVWEAAHGLNPAVNDRNGDLDGDRLNNVLEYVLGTNPGNPDTDGDGLADGWEVDHHFDPKVAVPLTQDTDGDGLPDRWEYLVGTDPFNKDTNANQIDDGDEDDDGDGLTSLQEYQQGTDPHDFYNGLVPVLTPLADYSVKLGQDGMVAVQVTTPAGVPLPNAPVQFDSSEENLLTVNPYGEGKGRSLIARADARGVARVYVRPANP